jgi:hypothetical protein
MRQVDRRLDFVHILTCIQTRHESDEPRHLPYYSLEEATLPRCLSPLLRAGR